MPMTYAPVNLAKSLARDPKALAELHMDRTTASYKMTHGLAEGFQQKLISSLQKFPFSMNIDESTSKNHKVLCWCRTTIQMRRRLWLNTGVQLK